VETSHPVVLVFTLTNNGPRAITSSADQSYTSVQNGSIADQLCVFPNGNAFNPDSPSCEYGGLKAHQSARMTLIVQPDPTASGQPLSVRVCASNESGVPDPVARNDCLSLTVSLQSMTGWGGLACGLPAGGRAARNPPSLIADRTGLVASPFST
jgi:hypothetical protein